MISNEWTFRNSYRMDKEGPKAMTSNDWIQRSEREKTSSDRRIDDLEKKLEAAQRKIKELTKLVAVLEDEIDELVERLGA